MKNIVDKKISARIKALLAKASGLENEIEAALFASKAAEMLQQHNLSEADLGGEDSNEPVVQRVMNSVDWNPWRMNIVQALAGLYFSDIYVTQQIFKGKLRRAIMLVGKNHNLDVVESMHEYLVKTTLRLAKAYSSDRKKVLQFEKGCGGRLSQRIREMAEKAKAPDPRITYQSGQTTLPALYKTELAEVKSVIDEVCGDSMARRTGHRGGGAAAAAGRAAGDRVSLGGQIGVKAGTRLLS